ncbi:MAG TPA: hypothetical protein VIA06_03315 [Candidatus Dormibacteraeota bacterium]|nr:hypothetical protein [Candidatus Dormibacteraeota bacterium]
MRRDWDVIIAGASFAGLAAALELARAGRVLLLDAEEIGDHQTSACATPVEVLRRLQLEETEEQRHEELIFHLPGGGVRHFRPRLPFATFDYRAFCRGLAARGDAEFLRTRVVGLEGDRVLTREGEFTAPVLIDASGWRAALGVSLDPGQVRVRDRAVGLEARVPRQNQGLHFWIGDGIARDGYLWDFPAGDHSRVGLLRYRSGGGLKPRLVQFLEQEVGDLPLHGGVLTSRHREPVQGRVMIVGDAAGQCLPLSGEGIRPALCFGQIAGRLARQVVEGRRPLEDALACYRRQAMRPRLIYRFLALIERTMPLLPDPLIGPMTWYFGSGPMAPACEAAYWRLAPPEALRPRALP